MTTYRQESYEPFPPYITTLGNHDTVCLPALSELYYYVEDVIISNLQTTARTVSLYLRPDTAAPGITNQICNALAIAANTLYQMPIGPLVVPPGYVVSGSANITMGVNIILTGTYRLLPPPEARK